MNKETINWEKIFAKHITNEGLVFRTYKTFNNKTNNKKTDISVLKIGKRYNRGFLIEATNGQKAP